MRISREQLYAEVWAEPMTKVATRYGTYLNILARACERLNIPRPPQGYWAKRAVGRAAGKPPLPEARPGDELAWIRGEWAGVAVPLPESVGGQKRSKARPTTHPLIVEGRADFEGAGTTEVGYLSPAKFTLADVFVSKAILARALEGLNTLFLLLERRGHRVVLAPRDVRYSHQALDHREKKGRDLQPRETWSPARPTLVFVNGVAYGVRLFEIAEQVEVKYVDGKYVPVAELQEKKRRRWEASYDWTTTRERPCGRLSLHAYCPYPVASWSHQWTEKTAGTLVRSFRDVVRVLEGQTQKIRELVADGQRKEEEERRRWEEDRQRRERQREEERRAKALQDSRSQFLSIVEAWARARDLEAFFADIERRIGTLSQEEQDAVRPRINRARELFGVTDALSHFRHWKPPEES